MKAWIDFFIIFIQFLLSLSFMFYVALGTQQMQVAFTE